MPAGRYAFISVADTGEGMDAETKARVFEPFFTTKPVGEGAGLGLASVYGTVTQSGGFIRLDTEPRAGLDVHRPSPAGRAAERRGAPRPDAPAPAGATPRALVVDDEQMVRELASASSSARASRSTRPPTALGALELVRRPPEAFDVLVTDVSMPGMGGRELAAKVAELDPGIRVVFMSGYSDEILGAGSDDQRAAHVPRQAVLAADARARRSARRWPRSRAAARRAGRVRGDGSSPPPSPA